MAVSYTDLKLFQASVMPVDFTTANIGGGIGTVQITGASIGEVHFPMTSPGVGQGDSIQYSKFFLKNDHATDTANGVKIWIVNLLLDMPAQDYVTLEGASAEPNVKARFLGLDPAGAPLTSEIALNATSVTTLDQFAAGGLLRVELRDATTGALVPATEDKTIKQGANVLGIIPGPVASIGAPGRHSATAEISIGLEAALNDTNTTSNASTPPTGIVFSKPNSLSTALNVGGGGSIGPQSAQGIWSKLLVKEQAPTSPDVEVVVGVRIVAA